MPTASHVANLVLEPLPGQAVQGFEVGPSKPVLVGRSSICDVRLPDDSNTLSRRHAQLGRAGDQWLVTDLSSRHGTFLNGVRLPPEESHTLEHGDVLRVGPWSFLVRTSFDEGRPRTSVATNDDVGEAELRVEKVPDRELSLRAQHRLDLLLECAASIAGATSELALAQAVLEAAVRGTAFPRAALARSVGAGERVEIIGVMDTTLGPEAPSTTAPSFTLSRSLLRAAQVEKGLVRLDSATAAERNMGQSVLSLGIHTAFCAPVLVGGEAAAFLYLDARRAERPIEPDAAGFCQAIGRLAGLALANLKRVELEQRQRLLEADLNAARAAQRLIMPHTAGVFPAVSTAADPPGAQRHFKYAMQSVPGRLVAGDLFDVFPLASGKLGFFIGDVSGKGVGAALLMATAQAHLSALLRQTGDPAASLGALGALLAGRVLPGQFVTILAGVIDPTIDSGALVLVDAGHGHAALCAPSDESGHCLAAPLVTTGGPPVGVDAEIRYRNETVRFVPGSRLVLYSDGLCEQVSPLGEQFGVDRVMEILTNSARPADDVNRLFAALSAFAFPELDSSEQVRELPTVPSSTVIEAGRSRYFQLAGPEPGSRMASIAFADDMTIASIELE